MAVMSLHPAELFALLVMGAVPAAVAYVVVRLAVRHGVIDAHRRMRADQDPAD